jgi:amino acid transporter
MGLQPNSRLNLLPLIGVIFFIVCGGAYGLEPLVGAVGPGWAILLVLATPLLWSLPIALMVAELSSSIPAEGGYYIWVRQALGDFWGLQSGWWAICYMMVDLAVYPVLFVSYVAFFVPSLRLADDGSVSVQTFLMRWLIACLVIAFALLINLRGARTVGHSSAVNLLLVLLPFAAITIGTLYMGGVFQNSISVIASDLSHQPDRSLLTLGLSTILWNYMGWDDVSTFAGEVNNPQTNYPRAIAAALILTIAFYFVPLFFGISVTTNPELWSETKGWPDIAVLIGGPKFGLAIAAGALISTWALFNSQLLYVSRLPYALALDNWLPSPLRIINTRTRVPMVSVILVACVAALCSALSFGKLIVIDVLLYSAVLSIQFIALIVLRLKQPNMPRPFRIPGGWPVLAAITLAPMFCATILLLSILFGGFSEVWQVAVVFIVMMTGLILYLTRRRQHQRNISDLEFH